MAKITMLSLETWLDSQNKSLFDNLTLPDGYIKNDITDNIMMRACEMEVLYPDPDFFTAAIGLWGKKHYKTFDKWLTALNIEYNPLENYDRKEDYTDTHTGTDSTEMGAQHSSSTIGQQVNTNVLGEITNTDVMAQQHTVNENAVSAYDANTYQPNEKNDATVDAHTDTHTQGSHTDTSTAGSHTDTTDADAHTDTTTYDTSVVHDARIHGNIGVTTSQQMLQSELDIALWNLYEHIADLFITEFCIMIY